MARSERHRLAEKRGGRATMLSIEWERAEERYLDEPVDVMDPERLYERAWAMQMLQTVRAQVRESFVRHERLAEYHALEPHLDGDEAAAPYEELAPVLDLTPSAVRVLVHRLRQKYRALLEMEIARTGVSPEDVDGELAWLRQVLAGRG